MRPSVRNAGGHPIVQGKSLGLAHWSSPDATNSWGMRFSFRYFRTARLLGVPNEPNTNSAFSASTKLRVRPIACNGSELSSYEMNSTAPVDAAAFVEHLKVGGLRSSDGTEGSQLARIRHDIADTDSRVR